jgi:hypothetical protein
MTMGTARIGLGQLARRQPVVRPGGGRIGVGTDACPGLGLAGVDR